MKQKYLGVLKHYRLIISISLLLFSFITGLAMGFGYVTKASPETADPPKEIQASTEIGRLDTEGPAMALEISGNYVYLADGLGGLRVIDISTPLSPSEVGYWNYSGAGNIVQVKLQGNYAYVLEDNNTYNSWDGLRIINITTPTNPTLVGSCRVGWLILDGRYDYWSRASDIVIQSPTECFIVGSRSGVSGIATATITNPSRVGVFYHPQENSRAIDISGSYTYVGLYGGAIYGAYVHDAFIFDPAMVTSVYTGLSTISIRVYGNYVISGISGNGIRISDITTPTSPSYVASYALGGATVYDTCTAGGYFYFSCGSNLIVTDNNVGSLSTVWTYDTPGEAYDTEVSGSYIYIADGSAGLTVIPLAAVSDTTPPSDNNPSDASYELGSGGQTIDWVLTDAVSSGEYRVLINGGTHQDWTSWNNGANLAVPVNMSMIAGVYNYTIDYNDLHGNPSTDEVIITLTDSMDPTCNSLSDTSYEANSSNTLDWVIVDNAPPGYYHVLKNGTDYVNWVGWTNNTNLMVPVDADHGCDVWNYTIEYNDSSGRTGIPDEVIITIKDNTPPTSNSPGNASYPANSSNTIDWILTDSVGSGDYRVYKNGSIHVPLTSWTSGQNLAVPVDADSGLGVWEYYIQFYDWNSTWGTDDYVNITIYDDPPTSNFPPPANHVYNSTGRTIAWRLYDDVASGYYRVLLNGSAHVNWTTWTDGADLAVPVVTDTLGVYSYIIEFNDSIGNVGTPDEVLITIYNNPPTGFVSSFSSPYTPGGSNTFSVRLNDDVGAGFYRVWREGSVVIGWTPWTIGVDVDVPVDTSVAGEFNYTVEFNDIFGVPGTPIERTVTVMISGFYFPPIPGFEVGFVLLGFLAVAFFFLRRRQLRKSL